MISNQELQASVKAWYRQMHEDRARGDTIVMTQREGGKLWTVQAESDVGDHGVRPTQDAFATVPRLGAVTVGVVTVGLDVREYSRRDPSGMMFLTMMLFENINRSLKILRECGLLPEEEPRIIIQTGDGAYVVFTFIDAFNPFNLKDPEIKKFWQPGNKEFSEAEWKVLHARAAAAEQAQLPVVAGWAFSFIFALNALLGWNNQRPGFRLAKEDGYPLFPVHCRYAVSYDDVILVTDVNEQLNCVGAGVVTCARILSTDHGEHLLVHDHLMRKLDPLGGLNRLVARQWQQDLRHALLPEVKVKTGGFRYYDVFGTHTDSPLRRVMGRRLTEPDRYQIGSHDSITLESR